MANNTTKKTATKKTATKKTVSKATAKKAPVKKTVAPVVEKHPCGCDKGCACAGNCVEHGCCTKKKCTFGRFLKKLILFLIIFALGFAAAKMCCCDKRGKMGPRPEFENGCLVVKCPKMAEMMPAMDTNADGCVTREEFKAMRKNMKRPHQQEAAPEMPAPAPQFAE
ncbi:MAG: hypothetical protein IIV74_00020 [Alphaproteobacteria bacterium]|nr:hypothetical protein [Alphaproteobacteria bacterium]